MTHTILHLNATHRTLAHVDEVTTAQPWPSLSYGLLFVLTSYLIALARKRHCRADQRRH